MTKQMKAAAAMLGFSCLLLGLGVGLTVLQGGQNPGGFVLIGFGFGGLGGNLAALVTELRKRKDPALAKREEIAEKDERNQMLLWRSKARAFDAMIYVLGALLVWFALDNVAVRVIIPLVVGYLAIIAVSVLSMGRYQREM